MNAASELAGRLQTVIAAAAPRLAALSERDVQAGRAEGKWSIKQIVGHLIDSAANNHRRFVLAQGRDDLLFEGYDQEHWVARQRYGSANWSDLLSLWQSYNRHLVWVVEGISESELAKPRVVHSLDRIAWKVQRAEDPVTLAFLISDYIDHLESHLRQIFTESD